jgi:O-antigen biosynthesis protein WbqP
MQYVNKYKFFFDIFLSLNLFIFFLPILIFISFFLLIFNGYPIFFVQNRIGANNQLFKIYKFRTLTVNTKNIETNKIKKFNYVVLGKFMRKYKIDEFPQLINVLKGDMSLVGPRPALYNQYNLKKKRTKKKIHLLKPGITGYAQIMATNLMSDSEKITLDFIYCKNVSLVFDLKIIFLTVKFLFKKF